MLQYYRWPSGRNSLKRSDVLRATRWGSDVTATVSIQCNILGVGQHEVSLSYPQRPGYLAPHVPLAMSPVSHCLSYRNGGGDSDAILVVEIGALVSLAARPLREKDTSLALPG